MSLEPHIKDALEGLKEIGTVRGVCLSRGGTVVANRFPFSDERLDALCEEVETVIDQFVARDRAIERIVLGFDGGQLIIVLAGEWRLLLMHMIPDEADFVAKAARAFLKDHAASLCIEAKDDDAPDTEEAAIVELSLGEECDEPSADDQEAVPAPAARQAFPAQDRSAVRVVKDKSSTGDLVESPGEDAVEELPLEFSADLESTPVPSEEDSEAADTLAESESSPPKVARTPTLRELVAASRSGEGAQTSEVSLIARPKEEDVAPQPSSQPAETSADPGDAVKENGSSAVEANKVSPLRQPARRKPAAARRAAPKKKKDPEEEDAVVGSVVVHPVRLAAHQPQSTLPPPKRPKLRKKERV